MTERYLIPSVVHACEVFRLLASRDRGMTMQELEASLNLPRTTVCCELWYPKKCWRSAERYISAVPT